MYSIKPGVRLDPQTAMLYAAMVVHSVYQQYGCDCVLTSVKDGEHQPNSKHYTIPAQANDYRILTIPVGHQENMRWEIQQKLGPEFDVVLEPTHLHIEYDPKE